MLDLSNNIAAFPLDKIHCDQWGPSQILSSQRFRYYALFIYDCTPFFWLHPLKKKSNFFEHFIKFQKLVQNQFDRILKVSQCNGGGELMSTVFLKHLEFCEILQQISYPHTPQQNGVAERKYKYVVETGVPCKIGSAILGRLIFNCNTLINRFPSSILKMETPYHKLYGKHPAYYGLKVLSCRCYQISNNPRTISLLRKYINVFSLVIALVAKVTFVLISSKQGLYFYACHFL